MVLIPVRLPNGTELKITAGGQNVLVKKIVEDFCPRFTPGGVVVYLGDTGDKQRHADIGWETEVWVAEAPSHIIQFNGERFLGPYDPR